MYTWAEFGRIRADLRKRGGIGDPSGGRLFKLPNKQLHLRGGIHLTNTPLVPLAILKDLTATEYHARDAAAKLARGTTRAAADDLQRSLASLDGTNFASRVTPLSRLAADEREALVFTPWFLACNRQRFPYVFGEPDPRNALVPAVVEKLLRLRPLSSINRTGTATAAISPVNRPGSGT